MYEIPVSESIGLYVPQAWRSIDALDGSISVSVTPFAMCYVSAIIVAAVTASKQIITGDLSSVIASGDIMHAGLTYYGLVCNSAYPRAQGGSVVDASYAGPVTLYHFLPGSTDLRSM